MNEINNLENARLIYPFVAQVAPTRGESSASMASTAAVAAPHDDGTDTVEFSTTGTQLAELEDSSSTIRVDKVARIRSEIANGLYDVDGKLESILGRVLKDALS
ncbi:MAG: flagellar biosynthesis anti-sigma factor FlgM [Phycisphaerales bacterium]|nr:flagellar biosynthesis anti-sigma factor FlgM [Phycisphaerales bacterium]